MGGCSQLLLLKFLTAKNCERSSSKAEMDEWMEFALLLQQNFYKKLGNRRWDLFKGNERWALSSKVAFALFGEPKETQESKNWEASMIETDHAYNILNMGYTEEQRKEAERSCDIIYKTTNAFALFGEPKETQESKNWETQFREPKQTQESKNWETLFWEQTQESKNWEASMIETDHAYNILNMGYTEEQRKEAERSCDIIYKTTNAFALFGEPKETQESKNWETQFREPKQTQESKNWETLFWEQTQESKNWEASMIETDHAFTAFSNLYVSTYFESILNMGYTEEQRKEAERICDKIYETTRSKEILVAFLFVVGNSDSGFIIQPILRVKKYPQGKVYFVDNLGRVYKNWDDYKKNNKLPAAKVFYPASGIYDSDVNDKVLVEYAETPASSITSKLLASCDQVFDLTSRLGILGGPFVAVTSLSIFYRTTRALLTRYDRSRHGQNISKSDDFDFLLTLLEGGFDVGSKLAMMKMVRAVANGEEVGFQLQNLVNILNCGKLTVKGVRVAHHMQINLGKIIEDKATTMDVVQICSSMLFFANSAVNFKTAATLIEEVQKGTRSDFTFNLSEEYCFTELVQEIVIGNLGMLIEQICIKYGKELIRLWNGIKIAIRDLCEYLANLFRKYFSSKGKSTFPFNKIINFIISSERFAQLKECGTKEDFMDLARYLCIYVKIRVEAMEDDYQKEKNKVEELMGEEFDEPAFALKRGITDMNEREHSFLKTINDEIEQSKVDPQREFEAIEGEISAINEDGGLKFRSNCCALNEYLHCSVIDGEELSPSDFFDLIRELVDEKFIKISRAHIDTYCNEVVLVNVEKCNERKFLKNVEFRK